MQNILIIQTAFLGDVILATPVVSELQRIYPNAKIDFLLRKGNEGILENHPDINEIFIFNKKRGKIKEIKRLKKLIRANKYDLLVNLHRFGSSGILSFLSGAKQKVGFNKNPFSFCYNIKIKHEIGNGTHEVERNLRCIAHLGAQKLVRPQVYPSQENRNKVADLVSSPFVTLAPASVWFTKQLPEAKWVELAEKLSNIFEVYLVGGSADFELCERIRTAAGLTEGSNLAGKLNLLDSCALFERASRCYVNDSGPLHMASAVNAPTTAFFCATIPAFGFGPLSDDHEIRETDEKLVCKPCGLHGGKHCPEGHFKCGNITV
jgi:heptosyltransferase-2